MATSVFIAALNTFLATEKPKKTIYLLKRSNNSLIKLLFKVINTDIRIRYMEAILISFLLTLNKHFPTAKHIDSVPNYPLSNLDSCNISQVIRKAHENSLLFRKVIFSAKPRHYYRAIWTLLYKFWAHAIWSPKLKICIHGCGQKLEFFVDYNK